MTSSTSREEPVADAFPLSSGTAASNTSPSVSTGCEPPYAQEYLNKFRVPLPNVSARPMFVNNSAMIGFFGSGLNLSGVRLPTNLGLLAFSVRIPSRSIVNRRCLTYRDLCETDRA